MPLLGSASSNRTRAVSQGSLLDIMKLDSAFFHHIRGERRPFFQTFLPIVWKLLFWIICLTLVNDLNNMGAGGLEPCCFSRRMCRQLIKCNKPERERTPWPGMWEKLLVLPFHHDEEQSVSQSGFWLALPPLEDKTFSRIQWEGGRVHGSITGAARVSDGPPLVTPVSRINSYLS